MLKSIDLLKSMCSLILIYRHVGNSLLMRSEEGNIRKRLTCCKAADQTYDIRISLTSV